MHLFAILFIWALLIKAMHGGLCANATCDSVEAETVSKEDSDAEPRIALVRKEG